MTRVRVHEGRREAEAQARARDRARTRAAHLNNLPGRKTVETKESFMKEEEEEEAKVSTGPFDDWRPRTTETSYASSTPSDERELQKLLGLRLSESRPGTRESVLSASTSATEYELQVLLGLRVSRPHTSESLLSGSLSHESDDASRPSSKGSMRTRPRSRDRDHSTSRDGRPSTRESHPFSEASTEAEFRDMLGLRADNWADAEFTKGK